MANWMTTAPSSLPICTLKPALHWGHPRLAFDPDTLVAVTTYGSWAESRVVPGTPVRGTAAVHYEPQLVAVHAVRFTDEGGPGDLTVCGKRVGKPEEMTDDFDRFPSTFQCGRCTNGLGYQIRGER